MQKENLTAARVRELLTYDPITGLFRWIAPKRGRLLNQPIGSGRKPNTYIRIGIDGLRYHAHRVVWLYVHGRWPKKEIDHINGNRRDNRLSNLREADRTLNVANTRPKKTSSHGIKGIHRHYDGRWRAQIKVRGKRVHIGLFDTPQLAGAAYEAAAIQHFGEFYRVSP